MKHKILFITGPRQSGKTTLAKMISPDHDCFNFDFPPHRLDIKERSWDRKKELVIFDELHKMKGWKSWLKGIYDVEGVTPAIVVTGSARLDMVRKSGDSLAGRFFQYRLHPFDIKEVRKEIDPADAFSRLMSVGGFPEPFLQNDRTFYNRWRRSHTDQILRQDLIDLAQLCQPALLIPYGVRTEPQLVVPTPFASRLVW
ncbi:MAG: AAA family ATPase [Spirochaetia bacterium]|jgi:predicted AAA+ superfamily ATPase